MQVFIINSKLALVEALLYVGRPSMEIQHTLWYYAGSTVNTLYSGFYLLGSVSQILVQCNWYISVSGNTMQCICKIMSNNLI